MRRACGTIRRGGSGNTLTEAPDLVNRPINGPAVASAPITAMRRPAGSKSAGSAVAWNETPRNSLRPKDPESMARKATCRTRHPAAAGFAVVSGQRPAVGAVVEHRADHLAVEDHEVVDAGGQQLSADGSGPDDDDAVAVVDHRNLVRVQPRRAIGPNKPISVRNSANGAKPATWTSWRCGLVRAALRACRPSRPARR